MAKTVSTTSLPMYNHGSNTWRSNPVAASGLYSLQATPPTYEGSFIPDTSPFGVSNVTYAEGTLGMSGTDKIYIAGHAQHHAVGEFNIPTLSASLDVNSLPIGSNAQVFRSVLDAPTGMEQPTIKGIFEFGGQLIVGAHVYYDGGGSETKNFCVLEDADNISGGAITGFFAATGAAKSGGYVIPIPAAYQASFGGKTHWCGMGVGMAIIARASNGPNLWAINAQDIIDASTGGQSINAVPCSDYPHGVGTSLAGNDVYDGGPNISDNNMFNSVIWNHLSTNAGGFVVPGTRTVMFVGQNWSGEGTIQYKGTNELGITSGGYDTSLSYAKQNYYWLYDINDLVDGYNGTINPWDVKPYEHGQFPFFPFSTTGRRIYGVTYDAANARLYCYVRYGAFDRYNTNAGTIGVLNLGV